MNSYGLAAWQWNATDNVHAPPAGAGAVLDLRPEAEQAKQGPSSGYGLFAWPDQIYNDAGELVANPNVMPADAVPLGVGDCRELVPTNAQRDELKTRLGLSARPAGATLVDTLADVLGSLADPTGVNGPKPLLPTREGVLEIHFAYHSRVYASAFDGAEMFSSAAKGRANKIRDVLRGDLEKAAAAGGDQLVGKCLGELCNRWQISHDDATSWKRLLKPATLAQLLSKTGGNFKPRKPATSYSDDFNDGDLAGWTSVRGTWSNSGTAVRVNSGAIEGSARFESDVSSADHWADVVQLGGSVLDVRVGTAVRFATAAETFYGAGYTASLARIMKRVAGVGTNLASSSQATRHTVRIQANGSTISYYVNGSLLTSTTDTAITGNTRGGLHSSSGNAAELADDWLVDDGVGAGGSQGVLALLGVGK